MQNPFSKLFNKLSSGITQNIQTYIENRFEQLEALIQQQKLSSDKEVGESLLTKFLEQQQQLSNTIGLLIEKLKSVSEVFQSKFDSCMNLIESSKSDIVIKQKNIEDDLAKLNAGFEQLVASNSDCGGGNMQDLLEKQHEQILHLQSDTFYRMMRQYIFDTYVHLYKDIAYYLYEHDGGNEIKNVLEIIKGEMTTIGISFGSSKPRTPFNSQKMEVSQYPTITTNVKELDGCVAESIVPLMTWKAYINNKSSEITLQREEVIVYSFSGDAIAGDVASTAETDISSDTSDSLDSVPIEQPQIINPTGFLIQCRGDNVKDITCLYPIMPGKNIVGTAVKKSSYDSNDNVCRLMLSKNNNAPFTVVITNEDDAFQSEVLEGEWGINSKENHQTQYSLCNRDIIYINDVKFIFISVD